MTYNIRKIMMIAATVAITAGANAQTVQDGIKMYQYKKFKSAQRILEPLAATDAQANYYFGLSLLDAGNTTRANEVFSKFPEDPANISGTIRVAYATKNATKGLQIAKDLAAKSKKKEWIQTKFAAEGMAYSEGGDASQAIAWYKDIMLKNKEVFEKTEDANIHIGMGDTYRRIAGGGGDAMSNYEHVTEKDPNNSLGYTRIGDLWYDARNYSSALDNYSKAKDADPNNPLPYKSLANAYSRSGKYQQALTNLKKYYQLSDSTLADKRLYVEGLFLAQSNCDAAKFAQDLIKTENLTNEFKVELYGILGFSMAECGDSMQALNYTRLYFQTQDPKNIKPADYIQYGKLFIKVNMLDSAGYYYAKGIAGDTAQNKTDVYRQIAEAYKTKKDYCKSGEWYNNLIKANPETQPSDYAWRGIMFWYCKDYNKAMDAFNDFAGKYPDQNSAYFWQGRTQMAIDSEATSGAAVPYFMKWLNNVGGDSYEKKNDLKGVYEYLLYYFYNKKDKENMNLYKEKIIKIDPNDKGVHDIEEMEKAGAAPKKAPAPAKPKK